MDLVYAITDDDASGEGCSADCFVDRTAIGRIAHGPGLPRPVIERLLCSGRIRTAITSTDPAGRCSVLDLGRSHRVVTERQYKALLLRDRGCAHPGCRRRHGLQAHHVTHWIRGGRTDLNNLVLLCRRHHHLLHDGGTITANRRGRYDFHRTDGQPLPEHIDPSQLLRQAPAVFEVHAGLDPNAARTHWDGQRLDHHYAISALAS
jgi:hypothetical protein